MTGTMTDWVAGKINPEQGLVVIERTPEDFLHVKYKEKRPFYVAVVGEENVIHPEHVGPILSHAIRPEFIINVPSKTLWSGAAIFMVHSTPAAFGALSDLFRAASGEEVSKYRRKDWSFFERVIGQHTNVRLVTRVYGEVFEAHRRTGGSLKIALIDAYNMSAEDVRNARDRFGEFDIAVKTSSYGNVTNAAKEAAKSLGADAVTPQGLMQRLGR
jgi:hypothetical protein